MPACAVPTCAVPCLRGAGLYGADLSGADLRDAEAPRDSLTPRSSRTSTRAFSLRSRMVASSIWARGTRAKQRTAARGGRSISLATRAMPSSSASARASLGR